MTNELKEFLEKQEDKLLDAIVTKWSKYGLVWNEDDTFDFLRQSNLSLIEKVREIIEEQRKIQRCAACDGAKLDHTPFCRAMTIILSQLKVEDGESN